MMTQRLIDEAPSLVLRAMEREDVSRIQPVAMGDPKPVRKGFYDGRELVPRR